MLTKTRPSSKSIATSMRSPGRRRHFSPLMLVGLSVPIVLGLIAGVVFVLPHIGSHAAATPNMDCTLIVPANPLTAQGLSTPYQLTATNPANGPCNEANANQSAFVQGAILDQQTGQISIYSPLVIDQGTTPLVAPVVPVLPGNAVVALWFGFNGNNLTLQGTNGNTLQQARCVNGLPQSVFGQFSYCNAPNFFNTARREIAAGRIQVPALQTAGDGQPCPTTRDFSVVDQDQSDNVQTQYLANANGQTAQLNAANQAQIQNATVLGNPSDNALLSRFIDPALGCQPWQAPDLANNNTPVSALPLDEIQAAMDQQAPIALVPLNDPMTLNNNNPSLIKTDLYRRGVDQMPAFSTRQASGTTYCQNLVNTGLPRIQLDQTMTVNATSPAPAQANSLFTFLAMRFNQSFTNLNCGGLLNMQNPVTLQMDGNGVVIGATFAGANGGNGNGNGNGGGNGNGNGMGGGNGNGNGNGNGTDGGNGNGNGTGGATTTPTATATTPAATATATTPASTSTATGTATINLTPNVNASMALNITAANLPNQQISVNVAAGSCAATPAFTQPEDTDANGQNMANTVIDPATLQQLQALQTLPDNLFVTVTQNGTTLGCGIVQVTNGTMGTATLGVTQ